MVDARMGRPAVGDRRSVVAHDRVLVAEAGALHVDAARVYMEQVVEARRSAVAAERLEHERLDTGVAQRLVAARELAQVLDACDLEPDEVRRVVRDALRIGVGKADAHARPERVTLHPPSLASGPGD
jgi:hypothetical protein